MNSNTARPIVLYDGGCPLCSREINHYQRIDKDQAIFWCDISNEETNHVLQRLNIARQDAMKHMHVIDRSGNPLKGAYAFKEMWLNLPYYHWLGKLLRIPLITPVLNIFYNGFAALRWRSRKGEVCDASCKVDITKTKEPLE